LTSEQYGSPETGINVAKAPERASRSSFLAAFGGENLGLDFIGISGQPCIAIDEARLVESEGGARQLR
jgi:hypothetical protein